MQRGLKVIQYGGDPEHFEIVPITEEMTEDQYKAACSEVGLTPYQEPK